MTSRLDAISVRYIYSACVVTTTPDVKILHDPWFTEGIYDGSWFHFPKIKDPLESLGNTDLIYISHIHPDHYDSSFLKEYFSKFGIKNIIIADHQPNHLLGKMKADGFAPSVLKGPLQIGNTSLTIVPHKTGSSSDIDSALIIKYESKDRKHHCLVNANDIIFDDPMRDKLKATAGDIDILLCGFTGAGPYPQTYFDLSNSELRSESERKKEAFLERYKKLITKMNAKANIPFAGKYILGGKLSDLNDFRGVADPVEVLTIDERAVVLADNGGEIDTKHLIPSAARRQKYNELEIKRRVDEIKDHKMAYERLIVKDEVKQLPIKRLLVTATKNAVSKSECGEDYYFCLKIPNNQYAVINANRIATNNLSFVDETSKLPTPRSEIYIDPRYLFGLLTNIYHWNNAEVGSQYFTRRFPNVLNRKAQYFLNYLTI